MHCFLYFRRADVCACTLVLGMRPKSVGAHKCVMCSMFQEVAWLQQGGSLRDRFGVVASGPFISIGYK